MDFSMDFLHWENSKNGQLRHVTESNWNLNGFFNGVFNLLNWVPDVQSFIEFLLDRGDRAFRQRYMFRSVGDLDLEGVTLLSGGVPSKQKINTQ